MVGVTAGAINLFMVRSHSEGSVLSQNRVFSCSVHHSIPRAPDIRYIEPHMSRTSKWYLEDAGMNGLYVDPADERGRRTQIIFPNAGMESVTHTHVKVICL